MRALGAALIAAACALACGEEDGPTPASGAGGSAGSGGSVTGGAGGVAGAGLASGGASGATGGSAGDTGVAGDGGSAGGGAAGGPRGYLTTPAELAAAKAKADEGREPYKGALTDLVQYAGKPGDWSFGSLDGAIDCGGTSGGDPGVPAYIANSGGGPLVLAKAYLFHLTGDAAWAADARTRILDLVDTTGWGGEVYSGANQCILNLSWFVPRFIMAADLLEGWSGWSAKDKADFSGWLATEVYKKVAWSSRRRNNNWGSAASYTASMIADYLIGGAIAELRDDQGATLTLGAAFAYHRERQLARMNATEQMDAQCPTFGIRDHGGIPEELRRGSSGCDATYIVEQDASYTYQLTHIQSLVAHAELLWRRGSTVLFDNRPATGLGSILQSIHFVIDNPTRSWPWSRNQTPTLDVAQRYYRDAELCSELVCADPPNRVTSIAGNRVMSFTAFTHGFAPNEDPGPPPSVPPP
jgi:hypothetical protein